MTPTRHLACLLGLIVVLLFSGLGAPALTDRDEGANAEAAREMREQQSWISPMLNYGPRFAKPAFVYWLMAAGYAVLGVGELPARLPSAVATAVTVLVQYAFACWAGSPSAAFRAALVLLLATEVVALGRMALTDATLVLWTTTAGYAFFRAHHGGPARRRWYALMYLAMGLAALTKGPVGVLVPGVAIAAYLLVAGSARRALREAGLPWGIPLLLLVAGPWYGAMLWRHGGPYLERAEEETLGRVLRTVTGPGGTVLFYAPVVLVGLFPWSALLPAALVETLRGARRRAATDRTGAVAVFASTWVVTGLVLLSLFRSRLPHYAAPLFPPAALLIAARWPGRVAPWTRALLGALGLLVGGLLIAAVAAGPRLTPLLARAYPADAGVGLPGSIAVVGVLAGIAGAAAALRDSERLFGALATVTALLLAVAVHVAWPAFDARFVAPARELVRIAVPMARPCDDIVVIGPDRPSLLLYAARPVTFVRRLEYARLAEIAARPGRLFVLSPRGLLAELPPAVAGLPTVAERGGYRLLASGSAARTCP